MRSLLSAFGVLVIGLLSAPGAPLEPPPGWKVELVASAPQVRHPSVVCSAPDGRVFVAEDPMDIHAPPDAPQGRIICFHPSGKRTVFAEQLHAVFGMQYLEGRLYVLHNPKFSVFRDDDGIGRERTELIESTLPEPWGLGWNDHVPANFRLGMDGRFYLAVGDKGLYRATGRDGRRVDLHGGGIVRLRPDGTELEIFATGVRNILDVALTEEDELFTYDNTDEHEWMGRLTHMVDGGFYGYPFDFIPRRPYTLWMLADFGGGAATGTLAVKEDALPAEYRGNLFLADFAKRQLLRVQLARDGASFQLVRHEEMFRQVPDDFWPVGIAWSADARAIYICDWQHADSREKVDVGRLWKLSWEGPTEASPQPAWYLPAALGRETSPTRSELVAGLSHPSHAVRMTAQRMVSRHHGLDQEPWKNIVADPRQPAKARWHTIWALDAIDGGLAARAEILSAASDQDVSVARQAIRQLGERRAVEAVPKLRQMLTHADASLRFYAATALCRIGDPSTTPTLLAALEETDLFARYAVFTALNRVGRAAPEAWSSIVAALASGSPRIREGAAFALRDTYSEPLVEALCASAADATGPREAALTLAGNLYRRAPEWRGEWWAYHPAKMSPPARTVAWAGTPKIAAMLRTALSDANAGMRLAAVRAITDTGDAAFSSELRARFAAETELPVKRVLLQAFGRLKDREAAPLLASALEIRELLAEAITAVGQIGAANLSLAIARLAEAGDLDLGLRRTAIDTLAILKAADATPALARLSAAGKEPLRISAVRALGVIGGEPALAALQPLVTQPLPDLRSEAIAALGRLGLPGVVEVLLEAWRAPETRQEAMLALLQTSDVRALDAWLEALGSPNPALREQARKALQPAREQALEQISAVTATLRPEVLMELREVYRDHAKAAPLFQSVATVRTPADYTRHAREHAGNAWRGQQIFFDPASVACITCHTVAGHGGTAGPDLTIVGAQFPRAALIEHILEPSKVVREGYQQIALELRGGEFAVGALKAETEDAVSLANALGEVRQIPKTAIIARQSMPLSLMPVGLHVGLTLEQFADLIAYCETRKQDPRKPLTDASPNGATPLLNGRDLAGWKAGSAAAHWQVKAGVLEHDGVAHDLWTEREFGDFTLQFEWRWPDAPKFVEFPEIGRDGVEVRDAKGQPKLQRVLDAGDSGVFLRGFTKAQVNLFCYPIGSSEVWEYRTDTQLPEAIRRGVTPRVRADRPLGDWNRMEITLRGTRLTVRLNGEEVITAVELPGIPPRGPIGLQHEHGRIQFRNLFIREAE